MPLSSASASRSNGAGPSPRRRPADARPDEFPTAAVDIGGPSRTLAAAARASHRRCGHGRPPRGHNGEDPPGSNPGWVPDAVVPEEPAAEGLHKDGDGPDQANDRVDDLARLPGRSPVFANLDVTALGLGHGPRLRCPVVHGGGARGQRERCRGGLRPIGLGLPASAGPSEAGNGAPGGSFRPALDRVALRTAESCGSHRAHPRCRPERSSRSARIGIRRGCRGQFFCWGSLQWSAWGSWGGLGRGHVRICCKGAPRRDRSWMKARNINVSLSALRLDRGLCNRFGQPAPPRTLRGGRPRV